MIRKSWSGYAPVETTLELLASALRDVKGRMRQLFAQERTAANAGLFLDGLLSEEQRNTSHPKRHGTFSSAIPTASIPSPIVLGHGSILRFRRSPRGRFSLCHSVS